MGRTRTVIDCALWQQHQTAEHAGAGTDGLDPHTAEVPYTDDDEALADAEQERARTDREARHAARDQAEADRALLLEHGPQHHDPVVQAAARLLAR